MKFAAACVFVLLSTMALSGCTTDEADVPPPTGKVSVAGPTRTTPADVERDLNAPTLGDLQVSEVTQTTAKVSWVVTDQSEALTTRIEYDEDSAPGFRLASIDRAGSGPKAVQLTELKPNTLYRFRLYGVDSAGNNATSPAQTFRTLALEDTEEPSISGVTAGALGLTSAKIFWFVEDENVTVESWITYGTTNAEEHVTPSRVGKGSLNYTISGLSADTNYRFRVHAMDLRLNQDSSTERQFRTLQIPDQVKPTVPELRNTEPTLSSTVIQWDVQDDSLAASSRLEWSPPVIIDGISVNHTEERPGTGPQDFTFEGLPSSTTFQYWIYAVDGAGNVYVTPPKAFRTKTPIETNPPTITGIQTTRLLYNQAEIQWTPDDDTSQVWSRLEYRKTGNAEWNKRIEQIGPGLKVDTITGLTSLTAYEYRILARDPNNNHAASAIFTFSTPFYDPQPPGIENLAEGTPALKTMTISFRLTDNYGVKSARISLGLEPDPDALSIVTTFSEAGGPSYDRSYTFTDLLTNTTYYYGIEAEDVNNNKNPTFGEFKTAEPPKSLVVTSTSWTDGGGIPLRHACDDYPFGLELQPPMAVSGLPADTGSWVILVNDEDAGGYVHWAVWNLPVTQTSIPEEADVTDPPYSALQGTTTGGEADWEPVCPPQDETHTYHFMVYAVDGSLITPMGATGGAVQAAIRGEILAWGELTGTFG